MKSIYPDVPKSLAEFRVHEERVSMLNEPHVKPLGDYVNWLKRELGTRIEVPYFDPMDGGINARVLLVLETPGPAAVETNFVSRNNDDKTAPNLFKALAIEGFSRGSTALWNVAPWNISKIGKNENARISDVRRGTPYLIKLLSLFPSLTTIVLCGNMAKLAGNDIRKLGRFSVHGTYHFSDRAFRPYAQREHIHQTLRSIISANL